MALGFALALQSGAAVAQTAEPPLELRLDGQVVRGFAAAAPDARERVALRLPGRGTKLIMQGPLAVVAMEGGQVAVLDRRTAKDARILSEVSVGSSVTDLEILGQVLWVVTADGKRTSIPLGPLLAQLETEHHRTEMTQQILQCEPDEVRAGEVRLSIHDDLLHVSSQPKGGPRSCAVTKLPDVGSSAVLRDSAAYVPLRNRGLAIVDVSEPMAPRYDRTEEMNRRIVSIRSVDGALWTIDATSQIVTFDQQQLRPSVPTNRQTSEPSPPSSPNQNPALSLPQVPQPPKNEFHTEHDVYALHGQVLTRQPIGAPDAVTPTTLTLPGRGMNLLVYGPLVIVALDPVGLVIVETKPSGPMQIIGRQSSLAVASMRIVKDMLEIVTIRDGRFSTSMKKLLCQYNLYQVEAEPDKEKTRDGTAVAGQRIEPEVMEDRLLLKREEAGTLRSCASVVLPSTGRSAIATLEAAFVTLTGGGIAVVDIKDPSKPRLVEIAGEGRQLFAPTLVQGSLHLKDRGENNYRFSLLDPLHPKLRQFVAAPQLNSVSPSESTKKYRLLQGGILSMLLLYAVTVIPVISADFDKCGPKDINCDHYVYYIPVLGPWISLGTDYWGEYKPIPVLSGLLQAGALTMIIAGGIRAQGSPPSRVGLYLTTSGVVVTGGF